MTTQKMPTQNATAPPGPAAPTDPVTTHAANEALAELLFSPEGRVDPYARYRRLREAVPVHHSTMGVWVLTRYDDVNDALRSRQVGKDVRTFMAGRFTGTWEQHPALGKLGSSMLWTNPPEHTRLRRIVNRVFTTNRMAAHQEFIRRRVDELLAPLAAASGGDICNDLCFPLPLSVVAQLVGVPQEEAPLLREPIRDFQRTFELGMTAADLRQADDAADFLDDYYGDLVRRKQHHRGDDLLSALIDTEDEGERLSFAELVQMCHMIIAAGSETTTYFLTNGIRLFCEHPDQADLVRADPGLLGRAIDEVLRFDPPAHMVPRTTNETVEIGGVAVPGGARLMAMIAAANRDPTRFRDPDTFDVTRDEGPSISFGAGIHSCAGWRLARMQAEAVFPAVLGRFAELTVTRPPRPRPRVAFPQVEALHVGLRGGSGAAS